MMQKVVAIGEKRILMYFFYVTLRTVLSYKILLLAEALRAEKKWNFESILGGGARRQRRKISLIHQAKLDGVMG
jgi:hypothetical protein